MPTRSSCARRGSIRARTSIGEVCASLLVMCGACTSSENKSQSAQQPEGKDSVIAQLPAGSSLADSLSVACPKTGQRGSVLVARLDSTEAETGIAFKLLGDGAGPGVVLCRDVIYADLRALTAMMDSSDAIPVRASVDTAALRNVQMYVHEGVPYANVAQLAKSRRALFFPSREQRQDATVWPRKTLLHLKSAGLTQGAAYKAAVREGLLP
ncbi:MAG TPA: hypothetical protein VF105_10745 [Gemmatimonadaceae bacterium]